VQSLATSLRERLFEIDGVTVHDTGRVRCAIVTFTVDGVDTRLLFRALSERRINVHISEPSDTRLDFEARGLGPMIRASLHYFNTPEGVRAFCETVE
jgi:cysteine desulfurase/selenocysteine lyase